MQPGKLKEMFEQFAPDYDKHSEKMVPIFNGLRFLLEAVFFELPKESRILCVGVGTGEELTYLAQKFPHWQFMAVDPSGAMLEVCRTKAEAMGLTDRCQFHQGYLDSLDVEGVHDAATCFMVSHFILDQKTRTEFFCGIAQRLKPNGILACADLASGITSKTYEVLLTDWFNMTAVAGVTPENREKMRAAYENGIAILPPVTVAAIIQSGGFEPPVQFYQAGLVHAWHAKREANINE